MKENLIDSMKNIDKFVDSMKRVSVTQIRGNRMNRMNGMNKKDQLWGLVILFILIILSIIFG